MPKPWTSWIPDLRLSDEAFARRHRALLILLWLTVPLLFGLASAGLSRDPETAGAHHGSHVGTALVWVLISGVAACAVGGTMVRHRRLASVLVSSGLLLAASALVPAGGGLTDLHFGFFVVLGFISIYQDWTLLALSVVVVAAHHLITGMAAPQTLYSDPAAENSPVRWAALHVGFVLAMCAVEVAYWHFAATAQSEKDNIRSRADRDLRQSEERFRAIVQDSGDVIHVIDKDGRITSVSPGVERVMGHRPDDVVGRPYRTLIHVDDQARLADPTALGGDDRRVEVRTRHADGSWHWHDVTVRDLTDHPAVRGIVANHRDITERRRFQELLMHEATHDALTGLANRSAFLRGLREVLEDATGRGVRIGVLYLDLDDFKQVNDTLGHDAGDALLVATATTLRRSVLGSDIVGRLGGDEFGVVLTDVRGGDDAAAVARRILNELKPPSSDGNQSVRPFASIGIAISEPGRADVDELLQHADVAMYHAKRERASGWQLYVEGIHDRQSRDASIEDELHQAVSEGQLRVQYQPIVDIGDLTVRGFEALVRWQHPRLGLLPPAAFIPLAEQTGLVDEVGAWVLADACAQMRDWQLRYPEAGRLSLSVNVAPHQLDRTGLVDEVSATLRQSGLDPCDLILEVTESALVKDQSAIPQLTSLNAMGVRIALDDFGTGYSSLRYLTRLPVDILKLDRHFVAELNGTPEGSAVAESVIRLGEILHLEVTAEGIEEQAQAAELGLHGCRTGQGYLYSRPMDSEQVATMLAALSHNTVPAHRELAGRLG